MKKIMLLFVITLLFINCNTNQKETNQSTYQDSIVGQVYDDASQSNENNTNSYAVEEILDDGSKCSIISQDFVKSKLKYPEECDFENMSYQHKRENNYAIILNKFTSKNGYGVKISYVYKIWLQFNGGEWNDINNWSYNQLIIEGSDGTKSVF